MCSFKLLCAVVLFQLASCSDFDVALTAGDTIYYYRKNGTEVGRQQYPDSGLSALAYDDATGLLFVVDERDPDHSVFRIRGDQKLPIVSKQLVRGVAFDAVTRTLFWIGDGDVRRMRLVDERGGRGATVVARAPEHGNYADIAVDSCAGYIYWGDFALTNSTIRRSRLDGSEPSVFIHSNLYQPTSLAIDHNARRLYWADDSEGIHYKIESVSLDDDPVVITHANKLVDSGVPIIPQHIALDDEKVYWTDAVGGTVWSELKNTDAKTEERKPSEFSLPDGRPVKPKGIAVKYPVGDKVCDALKKLSKENVSPRNSEDPEFAATRDVTAVKGETQEKNQLYTLGKATPENASPINSKNSEAAATGDVTAAKGEVQETNELYKPAKAIAENVSKKNSKNTEAAATGDVTAAKGETKETNELYKPAKAIAENVSPKNSKNTEYETAVVGKGTVEEQSTKRSFIDQTRDKYGTTDGLFVEDRSGDEWKDYIIVALGVLCGALSIAVAVLVMKVMHLKKRPRIRKRIIVNKNVTPMTARPEQCEITIENCCNMNVCETPCFEPRSTVRPSLVRSKIEEKQNLIDNMEDC